MNFKSSILMNVLYRKLFGLFIIFTICTISYGKDERSTYPENVHQMFLERLRQNQKSDESLKVGTWGDWSPWSPCSRTCGTGVAIQSRECKRIERRKIHRGHSGAADRCVGRYKRFQLCNTQLCPSGYKDFRAEQCSSYNRTPYNKKIYTWEPYITERNSCSLNCRAIGLSFYATLNQSVIDGTPCGAFHPQSYVHNKVCVAGKCMTVGCDGILGSNSVVDACGICGGDNSTCRVISGIYSRSELPFGYNLIATLPRAAENISIFHVSPSKNYLALRELGGHYFLNGPSGLNSSGGFLAAGTLFRYIRPQPYQGDRLYASGPLTHSIDIMLFYRHTNPGIKYEYRLPLVIPKGAKLSPEGGPQYSYASYRSPGTSIHSGPVNDATSITSYRSLNPGKDKAKDKHSKKKKKKSSKNRYVWISSGYLPCNETCGGGYQEVRYICVKKKRNKEVPIHFCADKKTPERKPVRCNLRPCPPEWVPDVWQTCSVTCGLGVQLRNLKCKRKISPDTYVELPDSECGDDSQIPTAQVCQQRSCDGKPQWESGYWSECSVRCGIGIRKRKVICVTAHGMHPDSLCKKVAPKPVTEEMCDMGSCASDTWFFSSWDDVCSGSCGKGVQKRRVHCSGDSLDRHKQPSSCSKSTKPSNHRNCEVTVECGGSWFTGPWSECDVSCGLGQQRRPVVCVTWNRLKYKISKDESACKASGERPPDTKPCSVDCKADWFTSEWSKCSVTCGGGVKRREVKCLTSDYKGSLECLRESIPDSREACNLQSCTEKVLEYSEGRKTKYVNDRRKQNVKKTNEFITQANKKTNIENVESGNTNSSTFFRPVEAGTSLNPDLCMDRMKNCNLVYQARLCKLKYYNILCCETCKKYNSSP